MYHLTIVDRRSDRQLATIAAWSEVERLRETARLNRHLLQRYDEAFEIRDPQGELMDCANRILLDDGPLLVWRLSAPLLEAA